MVVTGNRGILKVGYQQAATLSNWSLTTPEVETIGGTPMVSALTVKVAFADMYWSKHHQFTLGLHMGADRWWVWDDVHIDELWGTIDVSVIGKPTVRSSF